VNVPRMLTAIHCPLLGVTECDIHDGGYALEVALSENVLVDVNGIVVTHFARLITINLTFLQGGKTVHTL